MKFSSVQRRGEYVGDVSVLIGFIWIFVCVFERKRNGAQEVLG